MKKVIIIGASGGLAKYVIDELKLLNDIELTLFLRDKKKLDQKYIEGNIIIEGDALDYTSVKNAVEGQDIVYVNLFGNLESMSKNIVKAMQETGTKRIIAISSMGIYGASLKASLRGDKNSPGFFNSIVLLLMKPLFPQYRKLAEVIESSGLDYTVLRPGRFTDAEEVDYAITYKGQPESGRDISRKSIATFVATIIEKPDMYVNENLGLSKPVSK